MWDPGSLLEWEGLESSEVRELAHQGKLKIKERRGEWCKIPRSSEEKDISSVVSVATSKILGHSACLLVTQMAPFPGFCGNASSSGATDSLQNRTGLDSQANVLSPLCALVENSIILKIILIIFNCWLTVSSALCTFHLVVWFRAGACIGNQSEGLGTSGPDVQVSSLLPLPYPGPSHYSVQMAFHTYYHLKWPC